MPTTCPVCGEPAVARVHRTDTAEIGLARLYRHRARGYVYLHRIEWSDPRANESEQTVIKT